MFKRETSPFDSSPFNTSQNSASSPRAFWQGRDPTSPSRFMSPSENAYDPDISASPQRRSSIEKLKKASRVKNSSMFAREQNNEYDPASPQLIERPLAGGRPLNSIQGNAFNGEGLDGMRKNNAGEFRGHRRGQSQTKIPMINGSSPAKSDQSSPSKSSVSSAGRASNGSKFDPDNSTFSEGSDVRTSTPRPLRRQAKSVTFDNGPPQVNEYEMVTPDPSSVASGSRQGSYESDYDSDGYDQEQGDRDDSFDASLEDTEKTPVVLPEDWRFMSPETANNSLPGTFEDPFDAHNGSPSPSARANAIRPTSTRSESMTSDGGRPLPSIPGLTQSPIGRGLAAAAERAGSNPRSLPSPPRAAAISKADILGMSSRNSLSIEDRLQLMGIQDNKPPEPPVSDVRAARAARLAKAHDRDRGLGIQVHEDETAGAENDEGEFEVPHISRESILRKMRAADDDNLYDGSGYGDIDLANLDPDVPIPSREVSSNFDETPVNDVRIKQEDEESEVDVYDIPDMYSPERSPSRLDVHDREGSVVHRASDGSDNGQKQGNSNSTTEDEGPPTPKAEEFNISEARSPLLDRIIENGGDSQRSSLPEFDSLLDDEDFKSGLQSYMSQEDMIAAKRASPPKPMDAMPKLEAVRTFLQRPSTPLSDLSKSTSTISSDSISEDRPESQGSQGSVIRRPSTMEPEEQTPRFISEKASTVKAPGSGLKARPSLSHADATAMAAQRRQVSGEMPPVPPVPLRSPRRRSSIGVAADSQEFEEDENEQFRKSSLEKITIDGLGSKEDLGLSSSLSEEFDRVIEAQKKGYLMRQNTKVVVARARDFSDEKPPPPSPDTKHDAFLRGTRSAGPSPRKSSVSKTWTTEPWNGKVRRKSIRTASGSRKTVPATGPVPPLPGQESNAISEETASRDSYEEADYDEGAERGRLFVKVVGVKDLDLPLPKSERTNFQLTLDNGLHCVTTSWLELNRSAPIGQEFELVVLNDLEFQLTLQTKLTPPPSPAKPKSGLSSLTSSPTKKGSATKKSSFTSLLMSPRKRKEAEARRQAEERTAQEQREREAAAKRASAASAASSTKTGHTAWDLLHDLVASDGSFARSYISLKSFEESCYGRPFFVDVPAYNEWAAERDPMVIESMRSKRGNRGGEMPKRPPYQVGKLQLQLLYVPKPKGAKDDDMPRSLNGAVRDMERVREATGKKWEGCLSQQGGDCPVSPPRYLFSYFDS